VSNNVVIFPSVYKSLPFDMPGDFTPIAIVGATPIVLVINPRKVAATNSREFAALLRAHPDQFNYGSGGNGTILHLAAEMYVEEAGAKARHVPYRGVGPMVTDLIGGQIDFATAALPSVQQHIRSGALRAIGVGGAQRTPAAPEIATIAEQGLPGYVVEAWFGVLGPKAMAGADIQRVHAALVAALGDPEVRDLMARQGNTIAISSPEFAQQYFRSEKDRYAKLVKKAGIELQ
jgi:tripartite-type tricarboxylate transporter receptor subunit TctC